MIKVESAKDIKRFFYYYKRLENPHNDVLLLLKAIENEQLLSSIQLIDFRAEVVQGKKVTVYPNGIIFWKEMILTGDIINDCIKFIKQEAKGTPVFLQLVPQKILEQEEKMQKAIELNCTVGQYIDATYRLEKEEEALLQQYREWSRDFQDIKKERIDAILDRYLIQKDLYEIFSEEKYKRKMSKWKTIFQIVQKL